LIVDTDPWHDRRRRRSRAGDKKSLMKAVLCERLGPPEDLVLADLPEPVAAPGEAIVAVNSVGLNFYDTLAIEGKYQVKPALPFSPGGEIAGTVEHVADDVTTMKPGDRVMAYIGFGGARDKIAVSALRLVAIPAGLSDATAAALSVTYGTTFHALKDRARLEPGERLVVLGASGGVGQAAVEIGKRMGARVIACASSEDKLAFCKEIGADELVNYAKSDLRDALKRLTDGNGADVIYDPVGGALAEPALRAIAWRGRYLVIGFASGEIPKLPLNLVLLKECDVLDVYWGVHTEKEPDLHRANLAQLLAWATDGSIKPHIHRTYPLADTPAALTAIARREVKGKVILVPR
jgi:NADPH2:quinone reductase